MASQQRIRFRLHVGGQFVQVSSIGSANFEAMQKTLEPNLPHRRRMYLAACSGFILEARSSTNHLTRTAATCEISHQTKFPTTDAFRPPRSDLCLRINEKLSRTTSIKYIAPGEDLSPDNLISVEGDDDYRELQEEYWTSLSQAHQSDRTFRVKLFLSSALQDEIELDMEPELVVLTDNFDPSEWCGDDEDEDASFKPEGATHDRTGSPANENVPSREAMQWDQPRLPSLKSLVANEAELEYRGVPSCQYDYKGFDSLPSDFVPAFADRPSDEKRHKGIFAGIVASNRGRVYGEVAGRPYAPNPQMTDDMDLLDPYHDDKLDRHAMDNLLQSVLSKSAFSPQQPLERRRRPFALNPRITEEMDLLDPYHEDDSSIKTRGFLQGLDSVMDAEKKQTSRLKQVAPSPILLHSPQPNDYSSLAGNFPSHISIFGGTGDSPGGQNGDGMTRHKGARALSGGADGGSSEETLGLGPEGTPKLHTSPMSNGSNVQQPQKWQIVAKPPHLEEVQEVRSVHLPSHISIFGGVEDAPMEEADQGFGGDHPSNLIITQEFKLARKNLPRATAGAGAGAGEDETELAKDGKKALEANGRGDSEEAFQLSTPKVLEEVMQVCIDEVQIIRKIGEGAFGEVSFANIQSHGNVAIKWLKVRPSHLLRCKP